MFRTSAARILYAITLKTKTSIMIKFENVELSYGPKTVFRDLSLDIAKGEKVVVLGRSGLGKSSLFALLLGFVRPGSGRVLFDGVPVDDHTAWEVRRKISLVDQDVSIGDYKVKDWFAYVAGLKSVRSLELTEEKFIELMDLFELNRDLLEKDVSDLSGGERQRIAIIVSVILKRDVFLLDESTSSLDKNLKRKVADFFLERNQWTVLSISHDSVWLDSPYVKVYDLERKAWKR